ncbi:hypothetical protein BK133_00095 [Paenibacillus sp. FSL H8-0548]|uniref:hypothetical protein n=1 Tax=Paenibacillus sp. FSL H8-0548 TaxID=1920422 RepID=UPI00096D7BEE|nr:hypothetical protein [Paenibacillus sp. FSL H8-0548]OMF38647.1 hypothetical protein BK133_00095 [Paenibacillus sp. FSL H8-0548]
MRTHAARNNEFKIYIVPAWKWKEFIAFELIGGAAFYLICRKTAHSELFGLAANIAGPQMLKYLMASYRLDTKNVPQLPPS